MEAGCPLLSTRGMLLGLPVLPGYSDVPWIWSEEGVLYLGAKSAGCWRFLSSYCFPIRRI